MALMHDFADSILDAHSNLDVVALVVVDFLVVDRDVHRFLSFDAVEVVVSEPFDGYLLWIDVVYVLAMLVAGSLLDAVEANVVYLLVALSFLMSMFFCCRFFFFDDRHSMMLCRLCARPCLESILFIRCSCFLLSLLMSSTLLTSIFGCQVCIVISMSTPKMLMCISQ